MELEELLEQILSKLSGGGSESVDSDEITTRYNSLYCTKTEDIVEVEVPKDVRKKYSLPRVVGIPVENSNYTLYYSLFGHEGTEQHTVLEKLRRAEKNSTLTVRLDGNPGGSISEGMNVIGIIKSIFNGKTTTVIDDFACSMAALVFATGDKRVAGEFSSIMFHAGSTGMCGVPSNVKGILENQEKIMKRIDSRYTDKFFTKEELKDMYNGKDHWMDSEEMCYRGIATHVIVDDHELTAEEYTDFLVNNMPIEEYLEIKRELEEDEEQELDEDMIAKLKELGFEIDFDGEEDED